MATRDAEHVRPPSALVERPHRQVSLPMAPLAVSSTDIRARLQAGTDPLSLAPDLVPMPVARYIATHQLYAPSETR